MRVRLLWGFFIVVYSYVLSFKSSFIFHFSKEFASLSHHSSWGSSENRKIYYWCSNFIIIWSQQMVVLFSLNQGFLEKWVDEAEAFYWWMNHSMNIGNILIKFNDVNICCVVIYCQMLLLDNSNNNYTWYLYRAVSSLIAALRCFTVLLSLT